MSKGKNAAWLEHVIGELWDYSSELLKAGVHEFDPDADWECNPLMVTVVTAAEGFCAALPALLEDIRSSEQSSRHTTFEPSLHPGKMVLTGSPSDYTLHDGKLVPRRWYRAVPSDMASVDALRFLLGLHDELKINVDDSLSKLLKRIESAEEARLGDGYYAKLDKQRLSNLVDRAMRSQAALQGAKALLQRQSDQTLIPSSIAPRDVNGSPAWVRFRARCEVELSNRGLVSSIVHGLYRNPDMADPPYLYQRWVGLQILRAVERRGWEVVGDAVGALFLGGRLDLVQGQKRVVFWLEPRLSQRNRDLIGWYCARSAELTPDFLFVVGGVGNREAWILDATLSSAEVVHRDKGKYWEKVIGVDMRFLAGVPVTRRLQRSWAVAPLQLQYCKLLDVEGRTGVVPLDLSGENTWNLEAFIEDILSAAR